MRGCGDYDWKKKDTVICLAGCTVVSVYGSGGKLAVFLLWREIFIMTGKKKIQSSGISSTVIKTNTNPLVELERFRYIYGRYIQFRVKMDT